MGEAVIPPQKADETEILRPAKKSAGSQDDNHKNKNLPGVAARFWGPGVKLTAKKRDLSDVVAVVSGDLGDDVFDGGGTRGFGLILIGLHRL